MRRSSSAVLLLRMGPTMSSSLPGNGFLQREMKMVTMGRRSGFGCLHRLSERGDDFEEIGGDAVVGHFKDGRVGVFVDGYDTLRALHADKMLDGAGDADGEIELGRDRLAAAAD